MTSLGTDVYDAAIVGGGFAGTCAALSLSRQGLTVCLIEMQSKPQKVFRAEKFSADQLELLQELGLLEHFKQACVLARQSVNVRGNRVIDTSEVEDYGLMYPEMVALLRRLLPAAVAVVHAKAKAVRPDAAQSEVELDNVSVVGVIRPPGVGIYRPLAVAPKSVSKHPVDGPIVQR